MTIAALLNRLDRVRQTDPQRWIARCPAHEDHSPSLSIRELDDGRVLIHDFAGCNARAVLKATGLQFGDLFPLPPHNGAHPVGCFQRERLAVGVQHALQEHPRQTRIAQQKAQAEARSLWNSSAFAARHPYLERKRVQPHGIRLHGKRLLIPMRDAEGRLWNLQSIFADGTKRFLKGGRVCGLYYAIGPLIRGKLVVCEGFATGATLLEEAGLPVAVAFACWNLKAVAQVLRGKFPGVEIIIGADNDQKSPGNPGLTKAREAARAVRGRVAIPPGGANDFNDARGMT